MRAGMASDGAMAWLLDCLRPDAPTHPERSEDEASKGTHLLIAQKKLRGRRTAQWAERVRTNSHHQIGFLRRQAWGLSARPACTAPGKLGDDCSF